MPKKPKELNQECEIGRQLVTEMLEAAKSSPIDSIELEWGHSDFMVMYFQGSTGLGGVPFDRDQVAALLEFIECQTKWGRGSRGKLAAELVNWKGTIEVEQYDSFGESCFRLYLRRG